MSLLQALPIIFFVGSLVQALYYLGWAQRFLVWLGGIVRWAIGTTPVESVNAIATTLLGNVRNLRNTFKPVRA